MKNNIGGADTTRCDFESLIQIFCLWAETSNIDNIIKLFEWA